MENIGIDCENIIGDYIESMYNHEDIQELKALFNKNRCLVVLLLRVNEKILLNITNDNCEEAYEITKELENVYHNLELSDAILQEAIEMTM